MLVAEKRNDRTRRGPMQRAATLPLSSRWPSTKGCNNTCGQPPWAPPRASGQIHRAYCEHKSLTSETRLAFGKCAPDRYLAPRETPRSHSDTAGETADRHHGHTATQQERGQTDTATQHPDQSGLHPYNRTGLEPNRVRNPGPVSKLQLKPLIYIYEINKKKLTFYNL